jgi:hypothetical protein
MSFLCVNPLMSRSIAYDYMPAAAAPDPKIARVARPGLVGLAFAHRRKSRSNI